MPVFRLDTSSALLVVGAALWAQSAVGSDLIVSANDGKYVRDEGVSTYPQPAPSDSLAVNNAAPFVVFAIKVGTATRVKDLPSGEAALGIVFARDNKSILAQFNVEKALAVYQIRDSRLIDTGERLKLNAGPVSIRATPR